MEALIDKPARRGFEAVSGNRLRYDFLTTSKGPDSAIEGDIDKLRQNIRQLEQDNGYVSGPIRRLRNNVIGTGIRLQSRVMADEDQKEFPLINQGIADRFNRQAERWFKLWLEKSDKRLIQVFYEQQGIAAAALERDGEVLVIGRDSARRDRFIPYCLEVLEADRLQTPMEEANNPNIRNGIRFDEEGVKIGFFILKTHPGDTITPATLARSQDFEEVSAFNANGTRKVMHLYDPVRPEQTRGYSDFASGLKDLQDFDRYREAEIMAALEDACMAGFVKTNNPADFQAAMTMASGGDTEGYERIHEFAPNKWHYLAPNQDVSIHSPKRPNSAFSDFTRMLLEGPANAKDIPPEVYAQNWQGMNYSNARTVLLQFYLSCRIRQSYLIWHLCRPVYENVLTQLVIHGKVQAPGFDRRREDYLSHAWIAPGWQWVDPVKEAQGKEIEVDNDFDTLADINAGKGKDWEETLEQRARELRKRKDLEEKYDITFPTADKTAGNNIEDDDDGTGKKTNTPSKPKPVLSVV
jgi:lambda family phage portal protein